MTRRPRPLPLATAEVFFPRPAWWASCITIGLFTMLLAAGVVQAIAEPGVAEGRWILAVSVLIIMFWLSIVQVSLIVLYRPSRTPESVNRVSAPGRVEIPGTLRIVRWTLVCAVALIGGALMMVIIADGGWRIVWAVVALLMVPVLVDFVISAQRPRRLVLTPQGLRAAVFRADAEVGWDDIARISYEQGMNGLMVIRVWVTPGAPSYIEHWRHPFAKRRNAIDIEPLSLDLDPLLLMMALQLFWLIPKSRRELESGRAPGRLFSADMAVSSVPPEIGSDWLQKYRPRKQARF